MRLAAALGEAGLAESTAFGERSDPIEDLVFGGTFGIERAIMPPFQFAMLLVFRIGDGVEEQFEAWDAADILRRSASSAVEVAG